MKIETWSWEPEEPIKFLLCCWTIWQYPKASLFLLDHRHSCSNPYLFVELFLESNVPTGEKLWSVGALVFCALPVVNREISPCTCPWQSGGKQAREYWNNQFSTNIHHSRGNRVCPVDRFGGCNKWGPQVHSSDVPQNQSNNARKMSTQTTWS